MCAAQAIDPALVTSRQEMGDFLRKLKDGKKVDELKLIKGWRRKAAGEPLLRLIGGEALTVKYSNGAIRTIDVNGG